MNIEDHPEIEIVGHLVSIPDYVKLKHDGNRSDFARSLTTSKGTPVAPSQVQKWIYMGCLVMIDPEGDDWLYNPNRSLIEKKRKKRKKRKMKGGI